jgi:hypothetical protein
MEHIRHKILWYIFCLSGELGSKYWTVFYQIPFATAAFFSTIIILPAIFIVNFITILNFWNQRKQGTSAELTVHKHTKNLILIAFGDFVCHFFWTLIDVSLKDKIFYTLI